MIVERLSFRAQYGRGDQLVGLFKEWAQMMGPKARELGVTGMRIYTDATGPMFSVQVESEFAGWPEYGRYMSAESEMYGDAAFQQWFARMTECTESGDRQLFNVESV